MHACIGADQRGFKYTEHKPFCRRYLGVTRATMSSAVHTLTQVKAHFSIDPTWAFSQRRDCILAWRVIFSVHGADPIAEV
jgi:hypothetical protein